MGGSRVLDLNVNSAKDLKEVNLMTKMDVYVIVKIKGDAKTQKTKTQIHADAGINPVWNFPIRFAVDDGLLHQNRLYLVFKIRSHRALGDKPIGKVIVPLADLLNTSDDDDNNSSLSLTHPVITPSGKPHGHLNFSYKFAEVDPAVSVAAKGVASTSAAPAMAYQPPADNTGYPYPQHGGYPPQYGGFTPPQQGYGYPPQPQQGYGYPPPPPPQGYGYPVPGYGAYPGQGGYGYPPTMMQHQKPKKGKSGLGMGLLGGMLGGLLIGEMIDDAADIAAMDMAGDF